MTIRTGHHQADDREKNNDVPVNRRRAALGEPASKPITQVGVAAMPISDSTAEAMKPL